MLVESWDQDPDKWENQPWAFYPSVNGIDGDIWVVRRCPRCGRYIKPGRILYSYANGFAFNNFTCKQHGDVEPFWVWDES